MAIDLFLGRIFLSIVFLAMISLIYFSRKDIFNKKNFHLLVFYIGFILFTFFFSSGMFGFNFGGMIGYLLIILIPIVTGILILISTFFYEGKPSEKFKNILFKVILAIISFAVAIYFISNFRM